MSTHLSRRAFVRRTVLAATGLIAGPPALSVLGANDRIRLGIMGANGRGADLARGFVALPGVEIVYVCDVDSRVIGKVFSALGPKQASQPKGVEDFRRILEDPTVDALIVATPDHWHGPATILACAAGKHVYVEKPACHNPHEGELMVAAARQHRRIVQVGTQRRSTTSTIEALTKVRSGELGRVRYVRAWYTANRGSIGRGKNVPVPPWLNYALWQGPAPERPYHDNVIHYNWHWFWHWGTGELGNNGIHALDLCRWGLGVDYPRRVIAGGGRYFFQDDQETPDTHVVTFEFGDAAISWEGRSCQRHGFDGSTFGAAFYGDQGTLVTDGTSYRTFDPQDKEIAKFPSAGSDSAHYQNFLDCIRSGKRPNADIEDGHKSTLLCHLGNIAYRTGRTVNLDPATHRIRDDKGAEALWRRTYRPGWEPRV